MRNTLIVISFLAISLTARAEAGDDLDCSKLVARLSPVDSYRGDKIPTPAQKKLAINALKEIPPDEHTSIAVIRKAIQSDYPAAYQKYYGPRRFCEKTRLNLIRMLMKFATKPNLSSRERAETVEKVRTELGRATFPSPTTTDLKLVALGEAFDKKVFDRSKTAELLATLIKERDEEANRIQLLSNSIQPQEMNVDLEKDSLADIRKTFGEAKNKKEVENLKQFQLAELDSVEKLEALYAKILSGSR
jgi:hypothetical protein